MRTVDDVYADYVGRRRGIIKALTTEVCSLLSSLHEHVSCIQPGQAAGAHGGRQRRVVVYGGQAAYMDAIQLSAAAEDEAAACAQHRHRHCVSTAGGPVLEPVRPQ